MTDAHQKEMQKRAEGTLSDQELIGQIARREMNAMSLLYDRYAPMVNGLALRITRSNLDSADVLQEVFLQVWKQCETYSADRGSVVNWICLITRTRALDLVRSRSRRHKYEVGTDEDHHPEPSSSVVERPPLLEVQMITDESSNQVKRALALLSDTERRALELAYYDDMSHSEIAQYTGLPLGTVKTHIARAVRKLRTTMETQEHGEAGFA